MTTSQCHSSIYQGPRRDKLFHEGETTSSKNHEKRFNKLIKSNQPRKHKATRNDRKTLSTRSKKSDAREAQEENCANNSLVYVQFWSPLRKQLYNVEQFRCCWLANTRGFFVLFRRAVYADGRMEWKTTRTCRFFFVIILNKAPGEENCLTVIFQFFSHM